MLECVEQEPGVSGAVLLDSLGGPPYGYTAEVVRACVAGLLRAHKLRIQPEAGELLSAVRDAGVRDVFEKERGFKRASLHPAGEDVVKPQDLARLAKFFEKQLGATFDREPDAVADAVASHFPSVREQLTKVYEQLRKLPDIVVPPALVKLELALERTVGCARYTEQVVRECLRQLDTLQEGIAKLRVYAAELSDDAVRAVCELRDVAHYRLSQLEALGPSEGDVTLAGQRIRKHLESERPWRDIAAVETDVAAVQHAYVARRRTLLGEEERAAEGVRRGVKTREGFATLTSDQSHHVLRPIAEALTETGEAAISPALVQLRDGYVQALAAAEEEANARLDAILSQGAQPAIRKVAHNLKNREIKDTAELERLLDELRVRITEQLNAGGRVRLV